MKEPQFYVYTHARPNTTDFHGIFYVGKGTSSRVKNITRKHNVHHTNIVKKYGATKIVIRKLACQSEKQAFELEVQIISILKRLGVSLTNLTDGGEGISGARHSDEAIRKISLAKKEHYSNEENKSKLDEMNKKRWSDPNAKNHLSKKMKEYLASEDGKNKRSETMSKVCSNPEYKAKIASSKIGNKHCVGRKYSPETLLKMSEANKKAWIKRKEKSKVLTD